MDNMFHTFRFASYFIVLAMVVLLLFIIHRDLKEQTSINLNMTEHDVTVIQNNQKCLVWERYNELGFRDDVKHCQEIK